VKLHSTVCAQSKNPKLHVHVWADDSMPQHEERPYSQLSIPEQVAPKGGLLAGHSVAGASLASGPLATSMPAPPLESPAPS
jgi:hypothetical protein